MSLGQIDRTEGHAVPENEPYSETVETLTTDAAVSDAASQISEVSGFLLVAHFAVFWTAFTLLFDYVIYLRDAVQQSRTFAFAAIEGIVLRIAITNEKDRDTNSHSDVDLQYSYRVNNHEYQGTQIRYLDYWTNLRV